MCEKKKVDFLKRYLYLIALSPFGNQEPPTIVKSISMIKRTKGRLLLTLLVITGLAGTLNTTALTKQERKYATGQFKQTRSDLLQSIKGLSDAQLNFRPSPEKWSIKECVYHITMVENALWDMLETNMKQPAMPEKRAEIKVTDEGLLKNVEDRSTKFKTADTFQPSKASWKNTADAATAFKEIRTDHLKYIKTTTEDLRNHLVQMPFGWIDSYQLILFIAGHSNRHIQQINEIKADPAFPKK